MSNIHRVPRLRGRRSECEALDRLLEGVRANQSQVLVIRGEAGAGKTALLDHLAAMASRCRIARAASAFIALNPINVQRSRLSALAQASKA